MVPSKIPPFVEPPPRGDTGRCWRCCDEEAKSSFCSHRVQRWEQISKQNKIHPVGDKGYGENEARNETGERWVCRGPQGYLRKGERVRSCSLRHFSPEPMILQPRRSQLGVILPSKWHFAMSSDIITVGWGWSGAGSGWRPGVVLSIL